MKRALSVRFWIAAMGATAAVILLVPLAYASPPDASWIPGIYDQADFDDVVVFLTSSASVINLAVPADLCPSLPVAGHALRADARLVRAFVTLSADPRAPPLS